MRLDLTALIACIVVFLIALHTCASNTATTDAPLLDLNISTSTAFSAPNDDKATETTIADVSDEFVDKVEDLKKLPQKKPIEEEKKVYRSRSRFPIRPPKLRRINATEKANQRSRIGYASTVQTRHTNSSGPVMLIRKTVKTSDDKVSDNVNKNNTQYDMFEISSSDHSPTIALYFPRRSNNRYSSGKIIIGTIKSRNSTGKRIPKLLLPRNLRPAMYSLHGFVPRPSMNRIASTEAPTSAKPTKFFSQRIKDRKSKAETNSNKTRKFGGNRIEPRIDDNDDIEVSGSRRRSVIAKRKGLFKASESQLKPSVHKSINNKHIKRKGLPGKDYPTLNAVPKTSFDCSDLSSGVYADIETGCQVWHICQGSRKHSFLCPNGTIFNERNTICDWWYNVDCPKPVSLEDSAPAILISSKRRRFT